MNKEDSMSRVRTRGLRNIYRDVYDPAVGLAVDGPHPTFRGWLRIISRGEPLSGLTPWPSLVSACKRAAANKGMAREAAP